MRYHLNKKTGGILKAIGILFIKKKDRATQAIEVICRYILLKLLPIIIELILVFIILTSNYIIWISLITIFFVFAYIIFTFCK
jgi:ABC-type transport system involved in Fe-S cluster assembly fused permease/ATPase subunit